MSSLRNTNSDLTPQFCHADSDVMERYEQNAALLPQKNKYVVLLLDDDEFVCNFFQRSVACKKMKDISLTVVQEGWKLIAKIKESTYDAIIMDKHLPLEPKKPSEASQSIWNVSNCCFEIPIYQGEGLIPNIQHSPQPRELAYGDALTQEVRALLGSKVVIISHTGDERTEGEAKSLGYDHVLTKLSVNGVNQIFNKLQPSRYSL